MAINTSDWCNSFYIWWANDDDLQRPTDGEYRMKIMDGGMLLFEAKPGGRGAFLVFAPHAWRGIHTPFDFRPHTRDRHCGLDHAQAVCADGLADHGGLLRVGFKSTIRCRRRKTIGQNM